MESNLRKYKGMKILIVDDDEAMCLLLKRLFERQGLLAMIALDGETGLDKFRKEEPDTVVLDIMMPGIGGRETMVRMRQINADVPVMFMTAVAGVSGAVDAMKAGAFDYIAKPFEMAEMLDVVGRALEERLARKKHFSGARERKDQEDDILRLMGTSDVIVELASVVRRVARTQFDVLITGEQGTGKSIVAKGLHDYSARVSYPFSAVACDAMSEDMLERELFGYEKDAVPDADDPQEGCFERSNGGTLYLQEISALSPKLQSRLLHAMQSRAVVRVGSDVPIPVDVRVVASTTRDLTELVDDKQFRADLYYRLNEYGLHIPSLRERKTDIPYLASRFIVQANKELDKNITGFTPKALDKLLGFNWPGNVSQLRAVVRRAVLFADEYIAAEQLDLESESERGFMSPFTAEVDGTDLDQGYSLKDHVRKHTAQVERQILLETLKRTGWNKAKAARILQIDYKTMQTKVKEYRLHDPQG